MAGYGHRTRGRGRTWRRPRTGAGPDRATLALIGVICAVAGLFVLGILLGPVAILCGWLAMGRTWARSRPLQPMIAVILGAVDTVLALIVL
ncbi:small hydrophobic protein [Streptomyces sp. NPDC005840]|uniref:small hydrophobic protein n=1 Tax=Streptomyces sp. NPDC005840 TaxID=3157072 RepID=UPI0033D5AEC1